MAKAIMVQGTASNVGKSIMVAALCRVFHQDGYRVVPFKSQNMALNSFVTKQGGEMGRAQVLQAQAAGLEPVVEMNPVLLKPIGNTSSQVIVLGQPIGNMSARDYQRSKNLELLQVISQTLEKLDQEYEIIVIEGAGSPAEVNLKDRDIANMRIAKMAGAPVLLVADIDRGGVLASIVGTMELLDPDERDLVKGFVINKFRGDITLLEPALTFITGKTGKPVLGVMPYLGLHLPEEDSVCLEEGKVEGSGEIEVAVIYLPRISNFTDFDPLTLEPGVLVRYVKDGDALGDPDLVIIPGTKNTTEDLLYLYETGLAAQVRRAAAAGVPVCGICGGFQMLGQELRDPDHTESQREELPGLGLLDTITTFAANKVLAQASGVLCGRGSLLEPVKPAGKNGNEATMVNCEPFLESVKGEQVTGYEIHMGRTVLGADAAPFMHVSGRQGSQETEYDGAVSASGLVWGSYFHGIFDNDRFRSQLLGWLRKRKGIVESSAFQLTSKQQLDRELDRLADSCRESLDMGQIYGLLGLPGRKSEDR